MTKSRNSKKLIAVLLIVSGILTVTTGYLFTEFIRPRLISISQSFAENEISNVIDGEVRRLMLEEFLNYEKITIITRDTSGHITSVSTNSVLVNRFANELDIAIGNRIEKSDLIENKIYLFTLLGIDLLSGFGPKVPVKFQPVSVTNADVFHTFEEAGINQTLHTIHLRITVEIEILMPFAHSRIDVVSDMPVAQTLIVGTVPDAYLNRQK